MIRQATMSDLEDIQRVIGEVVQAMQAQGSDQWDSVYPASADFAEDICNGHLFVAEEDAELAALVCLNSVEPPEYAPVPWCSKDTAIVIHRMAVAPGFQRRGIASRLMRFSESYAEKNGISYIKSDTYSINASMNALFEKYSYQMVGRIRFSRRSEDFYCYEKRLNAKA